MWRSPLFGHLLAIFGRSKRKKRKHVFSGYRSRLRTARFSVVCIISVCLSSRSRNFAWANSSRFQSTSSVPSSLVPIYLHGNLSRNLLLFSGNFQGLVQPLFVSRIASSKRTANKNVDVFQFATCSFPFSRFPKFTRMLAVTRTRIRDELIQKHLFDRIIFVLCSCRWFFPHPLISSLFLSIFNFLPTMGNLHDPFNLFRQSAN